MGATYYAKSHLARCNGSVGICNVTLNSLTSVVRPCALDIHLRPLVPFVPLGLEDGAPPLAQYYKDGCIFLVRGFFSLAQSPVVYVVAQQYAPHSAADALASPFIFRLRRRLAPDLFVVPLESLYDCVLVGFFKTVSRMPGTMDDIVWSPYKHATLD